MTAHKRGNSQLAGKSHPFRGMRINRRALWGERAVEISVSHDGLRHTSRSWVMAEDDATNEVMLCSIVALLARELEDEIMVYSKLEGAE